MCEKNKLRVYRELKEVFECKKYLYGVPDMGSKLLFRFRSGTHGLNEELGRYRIGHNFRGIQISRISWIWMQFAKNKFANGSIS